jgi:hypothetical protein
MFTEAAAGAAELVVTFPQWLLRAGGVLSAEPALVRTLKAIDGNFRGCSLEVSFAILLSHSAFIARE